MPYNKLVFKLKLHKLSEFVGRTRSRSGETEFLFQGDIAINKRDILGILNRGGGRGKRAVMKKLATKLWQPNKIAYVISSDLRSKYI